MLTPDSIVSAIASGGCSVRTLQMHLINELAVALLSIYTSEFPIRRMRVTIELMQFKSCQPSAILEIDEQLVQECERYVCWVPRCRFGAFFALLDILYSAKLTQERHH